MEIQEFQGLCPLCYKPVKAEEECRILQGEGRIETYHEDCLRELVQRNSPDGQEARNLGLSLLEQYRGLALPSLEKREQWIAQNKFKWLAMGELLKEWRERYGLTVKQFADQLGISTARLKRFESGAPVRDARLLYNAYYAWLYVYESGLRLNMTTDQLEQSQNKLLGAITLYEQMQSDLAQLSAAAALSPEGVEQT